MSEHKYIILGTVDGRSISFSFKENYDKYSFSDNLVSRTQKRGSSGISSSTYGQVNTVDLGMHDYKCYSLVGGTEELGLWNLVKRTKGSTLSSSSSSIGATTAARICPKQEFIAFATGSDWCKGLYEL